MVPRLKGWFVLLLLGGVTAYAIAEEITLTTYYPSPRGVYDELRTAGNVQIGSVETPVDPVPRLHIVGDTNPASTTPVLRIDDKNGWDPTLQRDATPFLIDADGNVGIGASPEATSKLRVGGLIHADGPIVSGPLGSATPVDGMIIFDATDEALKGFIGGKWIPIIFISRIQVTSAAYDGANVTTPVGKSCNGLEVCSYTVDVNVLGDPQYGVPKAFSVSYTCTHQPGTKSASLAAEANGGTVVLDCRTALP